jgi:phage tail-like protein
MRAWSDIRTGQINLDWTWQSADPDRPAIRLQRQQRAFARQAGQGLSVVDLGDLFRQPTAPWERIERTIYGIPHDQAEGGLRQAEVGRYFAATTDAQPSQVVVTYYDAAADIVQVVTIADVTRIESAVASMPPWETVQTIDIFAAPGGGPEVPAGQLVISTGHSDSLTADHFDWIAPGNPAVGVDFDQRQEQTTTLVFVTVAPERLQARLNIVRIDPGGDIPLVTVLVDETFDPDSGDWQRRSQVADQGLIPETQYYYSLFVPDGGGGFLTERAWRASALSIGAYGLDEKLYALLPAVHKQYDEPTVDQQDQGQLRRFLEITGAAANQIRSLAEASRQRHEVRTVPAAFLPTLARWIGWEPDQTLDELAQRRDIRLAPEVFQTVGTVANIRALVNRMTGWPCRPKEFVHNILLSNAPETIRLWELWQQQHDGVTWTAPASVTRTDGFDGRPSAALDSSGVLWLFWHTESSGRREIWLQRQDGVDAAPRRAMLDAPDDGPDLIYQDAYPAAVAQGSRVWLFWDSNREQSWDIWARPFDGVPGGAPVRLTSHAADDRHPAAVVDGSGRIWVFWQSNRRGPTDIWARVFDGTDWGLPMRLTTAAFRDEMPCAALDGAGRIWLFWSSDLGDRRNLYYQINDSGVWSSPEAVTDGPQRDEAPAVVFFDGRIQLFWHSLRDGFWQIWGRRHDGVAWDDPSAVTTGVTADKEPAVVLDSAGDLRLFWRSQRRGRNYQSRTIDTNDPAMLANLKTFEDRAHYSYDTGQSNDAWYARGAVGLYLTPDTVDSALIEGLVERVKSFVDPFRPLPVRYVWLPEVMLSEEIVDAGGLIVEEFEDEIT